MRNILLVPFFLLLFTCEEEHVDFPACAPSVLESNVVEILEGGSAEINIKHDSLSSYSYTWSNGSNGTLHVTEPGEYGVTFTKYSESDQQNMKCSDVVLVKYATFKSVSDFQKEYLCNALLDTAVFQNMYEVEYNGNELLLYEYHNINFKEGQEFTDYYLIDFTGKIHAKCSSSNELPCSHWSITDTILYHKNGYIINKLDIEMDAETEFFDKFSLRLPKYTLRKLNDGTGYYYYPISGIAISNRYYEFCDMGDCPERKSLSEFSKVGFSYEFVLSNENDTLAVYEYQYLEEASRYSGILWEKVFPATFEERLEFWYAKSFQEAVMHAIRSYKKID